MYKRIALGIIGTGFALFLLSSCGPLRMAKTGYQDQTESIEESSESGIPVADLGEATSTADIVSYASGATIALLASLFLGRATKKNSSSVS